MIFVDISVLGSCTFGTVLISKIIFMPFCVSELSVLLYSKFLRFKECFRYASFIYLGSRVSIICSFTAPKKFTCKVNFNYIFMYSQLQISSCYAIVDIDEDSIGSYHVSTE